MPKPSTVADIFEQLRTHGTVPWQDEDKPAEEDKTMAMNTEDSREWLCARKGCNQTVAIDEGGLTIVIAETGEYLEIGGIPEGEE